MFSVQMGSQVTGLWVLFANLAGAHLSVGRSFPRIIQVSCSRRVLSQISAGRLIHSHQIFTNHPPDLHKSRLPASHYRLGQSWTYLLGPPLLTLLALSQPVSVSTPTKPFFPCPHTASILSWSHLFQPTSSLALAVWRTVYCDHVLQS